METTRVWIQIPISLSETIDKIRVMENERTSHNVSKSQVVENLINIGVENVISKKEYVL